MTLEYFVQKGIPLIGFGPGLGFTRPPKMDISLKKRIKRKLFHNQFQIDIIQWQNDIYVDSISNAIRNGFLLIDYSASYGDGVLVGEAIKKSNVAREQLVITNRVSNRAQFTNSVYEEVLLQIKNMCVDYIDVLQFHWPVTDLFLRTWKQMERLVDEGLVKHLGVANCHQHHLEEVFKICKYPPEIGQFEIHPLFTQKDLIQFYHKNGIVVESYTPIARNDDRLIRLPLLNNLSRKYNKTLVQIILRWHVQNGCIPIIRCFTPEHQKEDIDIFDFSLSDEEMESIDRININSRLRYDPDNCDFTIL